MNKQIKFILLTLLLNLVITTVGLSQDKLGKIFVKAVTTEVDGQPVADAGIQEAVKDIKKRPGKFGLAEKESEANFLLIVTDRNSVPQAGTAAAKSVLGTLYVRDGKDWKPVAKLKSGSNDILWGIAAEHLIKNAAKWVKENIKN